MRISDGSSDVCSSDLLAAGVLGTQMFFFAYIFGVGFTQAVMPVAASAEGQGDVRGVRRSVRMGLWVLVLYSALVVWPLWHTEEIARASCRARVWQYG